MPNKLSFPASELPLSALPSLYILKRCPQLPSTHALPLTLIHHPACRREASLVVGKFTLQSRSFSCYRMQQSPFRTTTRYPVYPHNSWTPQARPIQRFNAPRIVTSSFLAIFVLVFFAWNFEQFLL